MYCTRCKRLFEGETCPECHKPRHAREPVAQDPCFLAERGAPWDGMLRDVLDQNGIPHMTQSRVGAALGMQAPSLQSSRIFVRYDDFERASALLESLFGPDAPR